MKLTGVILTFNDGDSVMLSPNFFTLGLLYEFVIMDYLNDNS